VSGPGEPLLSKSHWVYRMVRAMILSGELARASASTSSPLLPSSASPQLRLARRCVVPNWKITSSAATTEVASIIACRGVGAPFHHLGVAVKGAGPDDVIVVVSRGQLEMGGLERVGLPGTADPAASYALPTAIVQLARCGYQSRRHCQSINSSSSSGCDRLALATWVSIWRRIRLSARSESPAMIAFAMRWCTRRTSSL